MPLLGRKLDIAPLRRTFIKALEPFFRNRNLLPSKIRLYSDRAIGLASFPLIGLAIPAGVMIFSNLWRTGQKWKAIVGLRNLSMKIRHLFVEISVVTQPFPSRFQLPLPVC